MPLSPLPKLIVSPFGPEEVLKTQRVIEELTLHLVGLADRQHATTEARRLANGLEPAWTPPPHPPRGIFRGNPWKTTRGVWREGLGAKSRNSILERPSGRA